MARAAKNVQVDELVVPRPAGVAEVIRLPTTATTPDPDVVAINMLWRKARQSLAYSNKQYWLCGEKLIAKRDTFPHGQWLPWLKANEGLLGFKQRAAQILMKYAASCVYEELDNPAVALMVNRDLWGHDQLPLRARRSSNDDWNTPSDKLVLVRKVFGGRIDLDPASNKEAQRTVKAKRFYTREQDGLTKLWRAINLFLNPPYSHPAIYHFVAKLIAEYQAGNVTEAILLTHAFTDTAWFHEAVEAASLFCLTAGRICFVAPAEHSDRDTGGPLQGQCFFYFGNRPEVFDKHFAEEGYIAPGGGTAWRTWRAG